MGIRICALALLAATRGFAAPAKLSETGLYSDIAAKEIAAANLPFSPQYPLWSDGAVKRRWISIPDGKPIITRDMDRWKFPAGTKLWKEFTFDGRRVETRLEEKLADGSWEMVSYLWDASESDAALAPEDGVPSYVAISGGVKHDIPSRSQCFLCHRGGGDSVLGFEALQLSPDRDPLAPHAEPLLSGMATIETLARAGKLTVPPVHTPRIPASSPEARAAMGYLHANCGSCHNPRGSAGHVGFELRHSGEAIEERDEPVFSTAVNVRSTTFSIPGEPETFYIAAGHPERSSSLYRMHRTGTGRMPQFGTKLVDNGARELLEKWVRELR